MNQLKDEFEKIAVAHREEIIKLRKEHADFVMGEYTLGQTLTGMKGIIGLMYEPSQLDPMEGIRFRGYTIPELQDKLPKAPNGKQPLPEGIFYLMLMDKLPTEAEVKTISEAWVSTEVPEHVFKTIDTLPTEAHPMTQFATGIMAAQPSSHFAKAYRDGMAKDRLWSPMFDDVMQLLGMLPKIAAYIYRRTYHNGNQIPADKSLDWAGNFAHMLGFDNDEFKELARLYMTIHSDHEGGNVSAHTNRLVGSALSDAFLSFSAAMNGLAGPLHGLANQEVLRWILQMREELGGGTPSKEQIEKYIEDTLNAGRVIPGFGHAVLRKTDPRYMAQREYALEHLPEYDLFKIVDALYQVVPEVLGKIGKIKNPWPNVDAHSGTLLTYYGLEQYDFYTVMFGVSRALGVLTSLIWDRALMLPLERPKSMTGKAIKEKIAASVAQ